MELLRQLIAANAGYILVQLFQVRLCKRRRRGERDFNISRYMSYNANDERTLSGVTSSWINTAVQFTYDEKGHLLGEYTAARNSANRIYLVGINQFKAVYGSGSATKIYHIVTDVQNTPRRLIDSSNSNVVTLELG